MLRARPTFVYMVRDRTLFYREQFDDGRPNKGLEVTGTDLRRALDALLAGDGRTERQHWV